MRRSLLRLATLLALVTLLPSCGDKVTNVTNTTTPKTTPDVAVFANTSYIDYIVGDTGSEGSNLVGTFQFLKYTVAPFFGTTAADFQAASQGRRILAIPEQEVDDFSLAISNDAAQAIATFVNDGGVLMVFWTDGASLGVVNKALGTSLAEAATITEPYALNVAGLAGTPFVGAAATVSDNDATTGVDKTTLPATAKIVYAEATTGDAIVSYFPFGKGFVVLFGWDWYDAKSVGSQDGGWVDALARAAKL